MALTREQHEAIWVHLMTVVLKHTQGNRLWLLLADYGIENVTDMMGEPATADDMLSWEYEYDVLDDAGDNVNDAAGNPTTATYKIKRYEVNQVFILKDYIWKTAAALGFQSSAEMQHSDLMTLTRDGYDIMRTDPSYTMRRERIMVTTPSNTNAAGGAVPDPSNPNPSKGNNWTPLEQFKRSIKRDMSLFPLLKNDEHFERWNRTTITQASIQDVGEVLDHTYQPIDQSDKDLFKQKLTYMHGVFELTLLTDKGKEIVRKYENLAARERTWIG